MGVISHKLLMNLIRNMHFYTFEITTTSPGANLFKQLIICTVLTADIGINLFYFACCK